MNKPEKRINSTPGDFYATYYNNGFNNGWDIWEIYHEQEKKKWRDGLPTFEEITSILSNHKYWCPSKKEQWRRMAEAILKKQRGKR